MPRFTFQKDGQWCINGTNNTICRGEAVDQLAAYEDSKLTPDQVDQIRRAAEYMMFPSVGDFMRYAISNFEELQRLQKSELLEAGHWRNVRPYDEFLYFADCSHCHKTVVIGEDTAFCPACGWTMAREGGMSDV